MRAYKKTYLDTATEGLVTKEGSSDWRTAGEMSDIKKNHLPYKESLKLIHLEASNLDINFTLNVDVQLFMSACKLNVYTNSRVQLCWSWLTLKYTPRPYQLNGSQNSTDSTERSPGLKSATRTHYGDIRDALQHQMRIFWTTVSTGMVSEYSHTLLPEQAHLSLSSFATKSPDLIECLSIKKVNQAAEYIYCQCTSESSLYRKVSNFFGVLSFCILAMEDMIW